MQQLIADSGATKTTWALIDEDHQKIIHTTGLNPVLKSDESILASISEELIPDLGSIEIDEVWFYGAGCKSPENATRISILLQEIFDKADINVKTDIESAGLALYGNDDGIIVISGTGSSAGYMKSGELIDIMVSTKGSESDFGSGSHIGSLIYKDYQNDSMPDAIVKLLDQKFKKQYENAPSKIVHAKIMQAIGDFSQSEYVIEKARISIKILAGLLNNHFGEKSSMLSIKMIGSTAFYFEDIFHQIFNNHGIKITEIRQNPIEGLISYHKQ